MYVYKKTSKDVLVMLVTKKYVQENAGDDDIYAFLCSTVREYRVASKKPIANSKSPPVVAGVRVCTIISAAGVGSLLLVCLTTTKYSMRKQHIRHKATSPRDSLQTEQQKNLKPYPVSNFYSSNDVPASFPFFQLPTLLCLTSIPKILRCNLVY